MLLVSLQQLSVTLSSVQRPTSGCHRRLLCPQGLSLNRQPLHHCVPGIPLNYAARLCHHLQMAAWQGVRVTVWQVQLQSSGPAVDLPALHVVSIAAVSMTGRIQPLCANITQVCVNRPAISATWQPQQAVQACLQALSYQDPVVLVVNVL